MAEYFPSFILFFEVCSIKPIFLASVQTSHLFFNFSDAAGTVPLPITTQSTGKKCGKPLFPEAELIKL